MKTCLMLFLNIGAVVCLWMGLVNDVAGARNLGLFYVWVTSIFSLAALSDASVERIARNRDFPTMPYWFDCGADLAICFLLAWHGRWYAGSAMVVLILMSAHVRGGVRAIRERDKLAARLTP